MSETPDCPVCGYAMPAHEWACWIGNMVAANTALTAKNAMLAAERDLFFDQRAPLAAENERLRYVGQWSLAGKSPAFVHGYRNGVADANNKVHQRASVARARWAMITGSLSNDAARGSTP